MNKNYQEIKDNLAKLDVESLIKEFNALVGSKAWTSARSIHDIALLDAIVNKGIDVSAISDGKSISFKNKVGLSEDKTKLILTE